MKEKDYIIFVCLKLNFDVKTHKNPKTLKSFSRHEK